MKKIKLCFILFLSLILSTVFAQPTYYVQSVKRWIGRNSVYLLNKWGRPDMQINQPNGYAVYIYNVNSYPNYPKYDRPLVGVNVSPQGRPLIVTESPDLTLNRPIMLTCQVKFLVNKSGKIVNTQMTGNGCLVGSWPIPP